MMIWLLFKLDGLSDQEESMVVEGRLTELTVAKGVETLLSKSWSTMRMWLYFGLSQSKLELLLGYRFLALPLLYFYTPQAPNTPVQIKLMRTKVYQTRNMLFWAFWEHWNMECFWKLMQKPGVIHILFFIKIFT
jgi:hypothetical protein